MGPAFACALDNGLPPTILVADDSELNRELFRRLLGRCGYSVIETRNGCETLEEVEQGAPDLILLDLRMPEIDGAEVLRQIRRDYDQTALPIIIVTAEHDIEVAADCLDAGANDYITKPIVWSVLRARLETHLRVHLAHVHLPHQPPSSAKDEQGPWEEMQAD